MSNIISVLKKLPGMEYLSPANEQDIKNAEANLNLKFADEYKEYLSSFGFVFSDIIAVSGICDDEDYEVVALTNKLRLINRHIPLDFYAIEDVGVDGLVIWQNQTGAIYQSVPHLEPVLIFNNLSDFLQHQIED